MRTQDDLSAVLHKISYGRKSAVDTVLVRDNAALHGDVKIAPYKASLALDVYVFNGFLIHALTPLP